MDWLQWHTRSDVACVGPRVTGRRSGQRSEELDITQPNGTVRAMNSTDVARQWDAATVAEQRAMLVDAIGPTDQVRVLPFTGKRGTFDPHRIVVVGKRTPLLSAASAA